MDLKDAFHDIASLQPRRADEAIEHDFVLSEHVAEEKMNHALKVQFFERIFLKVSRLPKSTVISWSLFAFYLLFYITICYVDLAYEQMLRPGEEFIFFFVFFIFALSLVAGLRNRGLATNLGTSASGIRFVWRRLRNFESPVFQWDQILSATIFQLPEYRSNGQPEGRFLRLRMKTSSLTLRQHWWIWTSGAKLNHDYSLPFKHEKRLFDTVAFEIPLDAFTRDSDARLLLDLVTQRLGEETVGDALKLDGDNSSSFTQLWLDEAQSFRRRSIESLVSEKSLQNDRYQVLERIASGGQATVYRALDRSVEPARLVVLKELVLPVGAGSEVRKRSFESVKNEALLLSSLNHPGIIQLVDNFIEDHRAYLVLEHIEGTTLRDLVELEGPMSEEQVLPIIEQLCDIFGYLHGQSPPVVHRDFSPDNLMLMKDGKVKLLDFNVALQSESTATKTVVGKHHYIAPEQFRGKPSTQSDLYSIGASIYFLMTGQDPVSLKTASLAEAGIESTDLDTAVKKLTAMELTDRYASIHDLEKGLFCKT